MTNFVLVHGGAHGAWCWEKLTPWLEADPRVDQVVAVDLCGHGTRLEAKELDTIRVADYVSDLVGEIEGRDLRDVVLVGHSLAGISITPAAARVAERVRRLVFLSTSNPPVGRSLNQLMQHPLAPLSRGPLDFREMFCNDLDEPTTQWLLENLGPEPPGPMDEPVQIARAPDGVPSTYILLERDRALVPEFQREQARNAGVDEVVPFDAGHSAFASRPKELAELLLRYA